MKDVIYAKANVDAINIAAKNRDFHAKQSVSCGYRLAPQTYKINDDAMGAKLVVEAFAKDIVNVQVVVVGEFGMKQFAESSEDVDALKNLAMTVMFPYARAAIDQACALVGLFPLHLPILNTIEAFAPDKVPFIGDSESLSDTGKASDI